ncbi:cytochrome C oxidase subunit IV family protein [Winogradskyella sp.]|uniref:cytochrome C oxidase subunit IV family protein n=1 Tax=Winogradskyella sp. TaxID=1883156 RepID=UPI0025DA333B|nr:cytochrome C oxidase subunit IV family protein [Winogradskyella sp.]
MKRFIITLVVLVVLTILSAVVSNYSTNYTATIILILAGLKFLGIAYYFMDLIKAHVVWRIMLVIFLGLFLIPILILY